MVIVPANTIRDFPVIIRMIGVDEQKFIRLTCFKYKPSKITRKNTRLSDISSFLQAFNRLEAVLNKPAALEMPFFKSSVAAKTFVITDSLL
jgi:hypothetical protein